VAPTRRHTLGECSLLAVGDDWVVSLDPFLRTLAVYDRSGAPLGVVEVSALGSETGNVLGVAASGAHLALGSWSQLQVKRLQRRPGCTAQPVAIAP
jgi:hypothetical protein